MFFRGSQVFVVLCLALAVAGCARPPGQAGPGAPGGSAGASPNDLVTLEVMDVKAVRRGPAPTTVLIDVEIPGGGNDCVRNLRAEPFDEQPGGTIFVHVLFDSVRSGVVGACPTTVIGTATLTMADAIGDRPLTIDERAWTPDGSGYRQCDVNLGCNPPADHCASQWYLQAKSGLDIPQHSGVHTEYCDQTWMVLTIDVNAAACGAGGRPGCSAPPNTTRYFFRFENGWRVVARTVAGGCAAVETAAPDFPEAVCRSLGPTR